MASPVDSARGPRRPEELLALARRRGLALRRRRRAVITGVTALASAVVAAAVFLAVPGPKVQSVRTVAPAHPGGLRGTTPSTRSTGASPAGSGATTTSLASSVATASPGPSPCRTDELSLTVGPASGSAGGTYYELTLANTGPAFCTLHGYPGVSFLDASGHQLGEPAERMGNVSVDLVRLAPGAHAYVTIRVTDPGVWPCAPASSSRVRVYPPGQTTAVLAPLSASVCSAGHPAGQVGPVSSTAPAG